MGWAGREVRGGFVAACGSGRVSDPPRAGGRRLKSAGGGRRFLGSAPLTAGLTDQARTLGLCGTGCLRQRAGLRPAQSRGRRLKRWRGEEIPWFDFADHGLHRPGADVGAVRDGLPAAAGGSQTRPEQGGGG